MTPNYDNTKIMMAMTPTQNLFVRFVHLSCDPLFFWFKYLPITSPIFIFKCKDYDLLELLVDVKNIISGTRTITRIAYIWHGLYSLHKKDCLERLFRRPLLYLAKFVEINGRKH